MWVLDGWTRVRTTHKRAATRVHAMRAATRVHAMHNGGLYPRGGHSDMTSRVQSGLHVDKAPDRGLVEGTLDLEGLALGLAVDCFLHDRDHSLLLLPSAARHTREHSLLSSALWTNVAARDGPETIYCRYENANRLSL